MFTFFGYGENETVKSELFQIRISKVPMDQDLIVMKIPQKPGSSRYTVRPTKEGQSLV